MKMNVLRGFAMALLLGIAYATLAAQAGAPATAGTVVKQLGSIRKISGAELILATDQGAELSG